MPSFHWSVSLCTVAFAAHASCLAEGLSFQDDPLALAACTKTCGGHGSCWRDTCFCFMGWEGENCQFPVARAGVPVPESNVLNLKTHHRMTGGTQWADALDAVDEAAAAIDGVSAATVSVEDARNALSWQQSNLLPQPTLNLPTSFQAQVVHTPFKHFTPAQTACSEGSCSGHGNCRLEKCICDPGFRGNRCNVSSKLMSKDDTPGVAGSLISQPAQPTMCDASCAGLGECHPGGLCVCTEKIQKTRPSRLRSTVPSSLTDNMDCIPRQLFDNLMASLVAAEHAQKQHSPDHLEHRHRAHALDVSITRPGSRLVSVPAGNKHYLPYSSPTQDPKFIAAGLALVMFAVVVGIGLFLLGGEISKRIDLAKRKSLAQDIVRRSFTPGSGSVSAARFFGKQRLDTTDSLSNQGPSRSRALSRMRLPDLDDML